MANTFPDVDFNQYGGWQPMNSPGGQVYYKIPGHPGWIYSAELHHVFQDPTAALDAKKKQENAAKKAGSPVNQVIPAVASIGGLVAANKLSNAQWGGGAKTPTPSPSAPAPAATPAVSNTAANSFANTAAGTPPAGGNISSGTDVPTQAYPVSQNPDGSVGLSDGTVAQPDGSVVDSSGVNVGRWVQGAAGAYNIYSGVKTFQDGDRVGGGLQTAEGGIQVYNAATGASPGSNGASEVAAAADLYGGDQAAKHAMGRQKAGFAGASGIATAILDLYTGGVAGAVIGAYHKFLPGISAKTDKLIQTAPGAKQLNDIIGGWYTHKNEDQSYRDVIRHFAVDNGIVSKGDYNFKFQDGGTFDLGKDGNAIYGKKGTDQIDYDKDGNLVAQFDQVADQLGLKDKARSAFSFLGTKAVTSGAAADDQALQQQRFNEYTSKFLNAQTQSAQNAQSGAPTTPSPQAQNMAQTALRSRTSSPGIDKQGHRISY